MRFSAIFTLGFLFAAAPAYAGFWLQSGMTSSYVTDDSSGASVATAELFSSTLAGYAFRQGFVLGAQGIVTSAAATSFAIGPAGGLLIQGIELTAAYLPFAEQWSGANHFVGGGFAVNVGFSVKLFGPVRLGLLGTYSWVAYGSENGASLAQPVHIGEFSPQATLGLGF